MEEIVILAGVAVLIVLVAAICAFFRMLYVQERNHQILQEVLMPPGTPGGGKSCGSPSHAPIT